MNLLTKKMLAFLCFIKNPPIPCDKKGETIYIYDSDDIDWEEEEIGENWEIITL